MVPQNGFPSSNRDYRNKQNHIFGFPPIYMKILGENPNVTITKIDFLRFKVFSKVNLGI